MIGETTIVVEDDSIVIERDGERIILPREAFEGYENTKRDPAVRRGIGRTFEALEKDDAVENFGLISKLDDANPLPSIPAKGSHHQTVGSNT
mgnify:CR=1 FL=1